MRRQIKGFLQMNHYNHLTTNERENLLFLTAKGYSIRKIATILRRSPSTVSRELRRNSKKETYSPSLATSLYHKRRKKCHKRYVLDNPELYSVVKRLFLEEQWSPEEISNRLRLENYPFYVSYNTIYRAIYTKKFDEKGLSHGNRGCIRKLRHRGKTRHKKGTQDTRGKIRISNELEKRPKLALERKVIGHMEADTIVGKRGGACIVTMVDMTSRFLLGGKSTKKDSDSVKEVMLGVLNSLPSRKKKTITPDRGKEFACHEEITQETGIEFYFPRPHSPWDRGTNENTNGLLREYIPKSTDIDALSEEEIAAFFDKLNKRPRKCLGWKTPFEVFYNKVLHLV